MKKIITKSIKRIHDTKPIKFSVFKEFLEPDDIISSGYEEGYYSDNMSHDGYYYVEIFRDVLETDEEYSKRIERQKIHEENSKKSRFETYLKLKNEFESE